jgi:hypothetical protein
MPVLSSLNLPRRQKYAIVGVFALGFLYVTLWLPSPTSSNTPSPHSVCVISIVRLVALIDITGQQAYDATYTSASMIFWTSVEVNAAITCACIMTLKPLILRVFPRLLSPSNGIREPALKWISPAPTTNNDRDSSACTDDTDTPPHHHHLHRRNSSPISPTSSPVSPVLFPAAAAARRSSATSFHHHHHHHHPRNRSSGSEHDSLEKSRYYHSFSIPGQSPVGEDYDLDRDLDLEAQRRTCSDFSIATSGGDVAAAGGGGGSSVEGGEEEDTSLDPRAMLRAPPRAHLRMGQTAATVGVLGVPVLRDVEWGEKEKEMETEEGGRSPEGGGERIRGSPVCGRCGDEVGAGLGGLGGEGVELRQGVGAERGDGGSEDEKRRGEGSVSRTGRDRA